VVEEKQKKILSLLPAASKYVTNQFRYIDHHIAILMLRCNRMSFTVDGCRSGLVVRVLALDLTG